METSAHIAEISRPRVGFVPKATDMRAVEFRARVSAVLAFISPNSTIKDAYPKAARFLGLGPRRVRALHAGEARSIQVDDEEALFEAEVKISEHMLMKEMQRHADRLEYAALRYAAKSSDADRERIARWRDLARRVRRVFGGTGA